MQFRYAPSKKWVREGIFSLIYGLIMIFCGIYAFFTSKMGIYTNSYIFIMVIVMCGIIYRAMYYFTLPQKNYLVIEDHSLSIHRGDLFPRKRISFDKVNLVVKANEVIMFILDNGIEEPIDTELLSNEDKLGLEKLLSLKFDSKTVGFKIS